MKRIHHLFLLIVIFSVFLITSCDDNEASEGTIRLSITDAPLYTDEIVEVNLAVKRIDINGSAGWEVLESFDEPLNINLLDYQEGNSLLLTEETIEAGVYNEIRLVLDIAEKEAGDAANRGTYLKYADGSIEPLFIPSGAQSGYKAKGEFTIPAGGVIGLTVDFDARRAVVKAGNSGKYILKPVTRLVEDDNVAIIKGTVSSDSAYSMIRVFAYPAGTFNEEETIAGEESVEFPNAISSSVAGEDGTFTLAFMDSGSYDLVVALYDVDGNFVSVITVVENVEVQPGEILDLPLEL